MNIILLPRTRHSMPSFVHEPAIPILCLSSTSGSAKHSRTPFRGARTFWRFECWFGARKQPSHSHLAEGELMGVGAFHTRWRFDYMYYRCVCVCGWLIYDIPYIILWKMTPGLFGDTMGVPILKSSLSNLSRCCRAKVWICLVIRYSNLGVSRCDSISKCGSYIGWLRQVLGFEPGGLIVYPVEVCLASSPFSTLAPYGCSKSLQQKAGHFFIMNHGVSGSQPTLRPTLDIDRL